jgi:lipoprotein NlpI
MTVHNVTDWYDANGNYSGSPKVRDAIIAQIEELRAEALSGDERAQLRFARMVLACWPTIREALCRTKCI